MQIIILLNSLRSHTSDLDVIILTYYATNEYLENSLKTMT